MYSNSAVEMIVLLQNLTDEVLTRDVALYPIELQALMSGLTGLEPATSRLKVEGTNSFTTGRNGINGEQPTRC